MTLRRKTPLKRTAPKAKKPIGRKKPLPLSEVRKRFNIVTAAMLGDPKPRKKLRSRSRSNTGWYGWAIENVWDKRPHKCEVCGKELKEPVPSAFSHLLPRGSYRKYKTDERNISLQCVRCHSLWHEVGPMMLQENRGWKAVCERYYKLRGEANCVQ